MRPDDQGNYPVPALQNLALLQAARNGDVDAIDLAKRAGTFDFNNTTDSNGKNILHIAAEMGHAEFVATLLADPEIEIKIDPRIDPNLPTSEFQTPLRLAAENGHTAVVNILLADHRVDPTQNDSHGANALYHAARNGHTNTVAALLRDGRINPSPPTIHSETPLIVAAANGHAGVVSALIADPRVSDLNRADYRGMTPINVAAANGHTEVVTTLLATGDRVDRNLATATGETPIRSATRNNHAKVVATLLADPRVNIETAADEFSLLHLAVGPGTESAEVITTLLADKRFDPNSAMNDGYTPLHHAARNDRPESVAALLRDPRTDPNLLHSDAGNVRKITALYDAVYSGWACDRVVTILLANSKVDPAIPDDMGRTALHYAAMYGRLKSVAALLAHPKVEPTKVDNTGKNALHHATYCFGIDETNAVVATLLKNGKIDPNLTDKDGKSPLHYAVENNNAGAVTALLADPRVDINNKDAYGKTALDVIMERKSFHSRSSQSANATIDKILDAINIALALRGQTLSPPPLAAPASASFGVGGASQGISAPVAIGSVITPPARTEVSHRPPEAAQPQTPNPLPAADTNPAIPNPDVAPGFWARLGASLASCFRGQR